MPRYTIMANETWAYFVDAHSEEQAKQLVNEDPSSYKNEFYEFHILDVEKQSSDPDTSKCSGVEGEYDPTCWVCVMTKGLSKEDKNNG